MTKAIIALLFLSTVSASAFAADPLPIDGRVNKLEKEMKAVQRKVFPGGEQQYLDAEIKPETAATAPVGAPASPPIADLMRRIDALERALAQNTGQTEQNSFENRKTADQVAKMKGEYDFRLNALEGKGAVPVAGTPAPSLPYVVPAPVKGAAAVVTAPAPATTAAAATAPSGDAGKDAYMVGYDLWTQKKYPEAVAALKAMVAKYPKHKYASYARNLAGRAFLDNGQYNEAIREFFDNTKDEAGERAPQSYVYMAQALLKRKPPLPEKACQAYEVLQAKYPDKVTGGLADLVTQGKADAKCK